MLRKFFVLILVLFFTISGFALKENPGTIMFLKLDQQKKATEGSLYFLEYDGKQLIEKDPPGEIKLSPTTLDLFNQGDIPGYKQALIRLVQEELSKIIQGESLSLITYLGESKEEQFMTLEEIPVSVPITGKQFTSEEYKCSLIAPSDDWELTTTGLKKDTIASFKLKDAATSNEISLDLSIFDLSKYELATTVYDVAQLEYQNLETKYEIMAADSRDIKTQAGLNAIVKDFQLVKKTDTEGEKEILIKKAYFYTPGRGFILTLSSDTNELFNKHKQEFDTFFDSFQLK